MAEALSNNAALVAMDLQSAKSRLLLRKLSFLRRQLVTDSMESGNVDVMALKSLIDDPESLCLVKECRDLEDHFGTEYTAQILSDADSCSVKEIQKVVCNIDREKSFSRYVWRKPPILLRLLLEGVAGRKYGTVHYILEVNTYVVFRILLDSWHIMGMESSHVPCVRWKEMI